MSIVLCFVIVSGKLTLEVIDRQILLHGKVARLYDQQTLPLRAHRKCLSHAKDKLPNLQALSSPLLRNFSGGSAVKRTASDRGELGKRNH